MSHERIEKMVEAAYQAMRSTDAYDEVAPGTVHEIPMRQLARAAAMAVIAELGPLVGTEPEPTLGTTVSSIAAEALAQQMMQRIDRALIAQMAAVLYAGDDTMNVYGAAKQAQRLLEAVDAELAR